MARRDAVVAGVLLAVGAAAIQQSAQLPFGTLRNPGPGFVPWWASVLVTFLALILLAQGLRQRMTPQDAAPRGRLAKVVALLVVLAAYVLLLERVGYLVCTFLLVLFMLRVVDRHPWALALGLAIVAAVGSYVLFAVWLRVPLPPGPWGR